MVFGVPAEDRVAHAHVEPGCHHTVDVAVDVPKETALQQWQFVQIPRMIDVVRILIFFVSQ